MSTDIRKDTAIRPAASKDAAEDRYTVPALMRGLQLLMQFSSQERELSGAELSRRLELPRASVFRMLQTLEQGGFVERVGEGSQYKLGLGVLRLGFAFLASMELTEHGMPVIEALRDACGYSAHVVVRDGREVVFVAKAAGRSAMFHSIQVGARLPAHATVLGRVLLGELSEADLAQLYPEATLPAFTTLTPTTPEQLRRLVAETRAQGYAVSQSGFETGISTIAAPVFNDRGRVTAAVSISVPAPRIDAAELAPLVALVRSAAQQLSERISHTPGRNSWPATPFEKKIA
jgi:DNA-binding IclR family transcriptional regulator